jgi:hypothetical protein
MASVVYSANSTFTTSRSPSLTFSSAPLEDDVVIMWPGTSVVSVTMTVPSGWENPLGGNTDVESDAHSLACVYHVVTAAEAASNTVTFTATNLFDSNQTGDVVGSVVRGVNPDNVVEAVASDFNVSNTSTHVLPGVDYTQHIDSIVLSSVAKDTTGTYTTPSGWTQLATSNTTSGRWLGSRDALITTIGDAVASTNITCSVSDERCAITVVLRDAAADNVPWIKDRATSTTSATTSHVLSYPAYAVGDLVVMLIGGSMGNLTAPSGPDGETLTLLYGDHYTLGAGNNGNFCYYYIATSAEAAGTLTFTSSSGGSLSSQCLVVADGNFNAITPITDLGAVARNVNTTATFTGYTATTDGRVIATHAHRSNVTAATAWSGMARLSYPVPSGHTFYVGVQVPDAEVSDTVAVPSYTVTSNYWATRVFTIESAEVVTEVTPAVVTATGSVLAPTVTAASSATITPAVVTALSVMPSPTVVVPIHATISASTVTAVGSVGSASPSQEAEAFPATVTARGRVMRPTDPSQPAVAARSYGGYEPKATPAERRAQFDLRRRIQDLES